MANPDGSEAEPIVLIAEGKLHQGDRVLAGLFLSKLGLSTSIMSKPEYNALLASHGIITVRYRDVLPVDESETTIPSQFRFEDITSPEMFLVREHFEDFSRVLHPEFNRKSVTRAFHYLVDGRSRSYETWRRKGVSPPPGMVIKKREELGLQPFPFNQYPTVAYDTSARIRAEYGVLAQSVIEIGEVLSESPSVQKTHGIIAVVANQLKAQIL